MTGRDTTPPRPLAWWQHLSATWKAISVLIAVAIAASSAALYIQRYVTSDELAPLHDADRVLDGRVRQLEHRGAAIEATMEATREAAQETRDSVKSLTEHLLKHPEEP
jgi:hypothetical protein